MATGSVDLVSSQIDVASIVDNLIYVDAAPIRRMQSQVTTLQSKISAFQTINTRLSTLETTVSKLLYGSTNDPLHAPYSYSDRLSDSIFSKCKVTSSNESAISATADNANFGGTYSVNVTKLAGAESWGSGGFAGTASTVGTGSLVIKKADSADDVTLTIDASNNTLAGVCRTINEAGAGVTASIINDGSSTNPYRLLVTANESGSDNSFSIDESGISGQALGMAQKQEATDATFEVNGITISKGSNTITDVIPGVTFTLKDETTSPVRLVVGKDIDGIVAALGEFVTAYNNVNSYINTQFSYNSTTSSSGILSGDASLRNIQTNLQSQMIRSVTNRFTDYNMAGQVGLNYNRDGSLSLDTAKLREALSTDFTGVAALFLGNGTPANSGTATDSRVTYNSKTAATQAGTYSIEVTALATKAMATGGQSIAALSGDETLTITPDSGSAFNVTLSAGFTVDQALDALNAAFTAHGMNATATKDSESKLSIAANSYGSAGSFTIVSNQDNAAGYTGFGTLVIDANGTDIAGVITNSDDPGNPHAATGSGLTLTGANGQAEEGLTFTVAQTTTGQYGSIIIAPAETGVEGSSILMNMHSLLDGITDPLSGPIHNSQDALSQSIKYLTEEISSYQSRLAIQKELLTAQFNKADEALKLLQVTQSSVSSQLAKLG
jgi:flagellar hook-associated protein 2